MAIYRCAVEASSGGALYINVFHMDAITGSAAAIGSGFNAQVATPYGVALHTSVDIDQIVVTEIATGSQVTTTLNVPGTQTGDMLPPQAAAVLSWRTAFIGRKNRGRTYVFGLAESCQSQGLINGTQLGILGTLAAAIRVAWPATVNGQLVLYHRVTNTSTAIISHIVRDIVYSQRRRTLGVGA